MIIGLSHTVVASETNLVVPTLLASILASQHEVKGTSMKNKVQARSGTRKEGLVVDREVLKTDRGQ